jgi:hypothetical protein
MWKKSFKRPFNQWIANEPQAVIKQADHLMEVLALGMAQAGRDSEIIEWYASEFYKRFHIMLRAFGIGVGEGMRTSSKSYEAAGSLPLPLPLCSLSVSVSLSLCLCLSLSFCLSVSVSVSLSWLSRRCSC